MENIKNEKECGWKKIDENKKNHIFAFGESYINFLNRSKTEREANKSIIETLKRYGFQSICDIEVLHEGDKVYLDNRGKSVLAAVIGKNNITEGLNIVGSHIDSPRLDLKPNPIYEDAKLALFKTQIGRASCRERV